MHLDIPTSDLAGTVIPVRLQRTPDVCPRCHRSIHAKFVVAAIQQERSLCQVTFRCTHQLCQELFIATYSALDRLPQGQILHQFESVAPLSAARATFPESISELSPTFVEIFNQTTEAESMQLDQLVGIGLRKALEFLIKDFAVAEHPGRETEIRSTLLGNCITSFVADANIKECAKRAAWLGNDETHYTRKWESKDVGDLKLLVRLTVNWIENSILTKKYIAEMVTGRA